MRASLTHKLSAVYSSRLVTDGISFNCPRVRLSELPGRQSENTALPMDVDPESRKGHRSLSH